MRCHTGLSLGMKESMPPDAERAADRHLVINCLGIAKFKEPSNPRLCPLSRAVYWSVLGFKAQPFIPFWVISIPEVPVKLAATFTGTASTSPSAQFHFLLFSSTYFNPKRNPQWTSMHANVYLRVYSSPLGIQPMTEDFLFQISEPINNKAIVLKIM